MADIEGMSFYSPRTNRKWLYAGLLTISILLIIIASELIILRKAPIQYSPVPYRFVMPEESKNVGVLDQTYEQTPVTFESIEKDRIYFSQGNRQHLYATLQPKTFLLCNPNSINLNQLDFSRLKKSSLYPDQYLTPKELGVKLKPNIVILLLYEIKDSVELKDLQGIAAIDCL